MRDSRPATGSALIAEYRFDHWPVCAIRSPLPTPGRLLVRAAELDDDIDELYVELVLFPFDGVQGICCYNATLEGRAGRFEVRADRGASYRSMKRSLATGCPGLGGGHAWTKWFQPAAPRHSRSSNSDHGGAHCEKWRRNMSRMWCTASR